MNRIKYKELFEIINREKFEEEYLKTLFSIKGDLKKSKKYIDLQEKWAKILKRTKGYSKLKKYELKDLLIASFEELVEILSDANFKKNKSLIKKIEKNNIFNYKGKYNKIQTFFNKYTNELELWRCPYCDSAFTGFYKYKEKNQSIYDLDHFFPKSLYPFFALSLYNFIPSCQYCNERVKKADVIQINKTNIKKLLKSSPVSQNYNFTELVTLRFIPKIPTSIETNENETWHYAPLSQKNNKIYKIWFDTNEESQNKQIIDLFQLEDRYNSQAIKMNGLYLMDLKKRYPQSHINYICDLLNKQQNSNFNSIIHRTPEQIEKDIFHKDNKYGLLQKMKNDLLE